MRWILYLFSLLLILGAGAAGAIAWGLYTYGQGLPDYGQLADYEPPVVTRVHGGDGRLLAEYATERRVFVPISAMPKRIIKAFLSAEDKNFYSHSGIDFISLASAMVQNLRNLGSNRRPRGASTITQQVAKNFLLTNEVSIERKVKEAILAFRIERTLSKERILELYLNEIYLGFGSYGVAAAALNYFDKSLGDLTVDEAAFLAALPKAPNNYHPIRRREAAVIRRNWGDRANGAQWFYLHRRGDRVAGRAADGQAAFGDGIRRGRLFHRSGAPVTDEAVWPGRGLWRRAVGSDLVGPSFATDFR